MKTVLGDIPSETRSHIIQPTGGGAMMGGPNKPTQRKVLPLGRSVVSVKTIRRIGSVSENH